MDKDEELQLITQIRALGLNSGRVVKADGQWYIEGKKHDVAPPIINIPHWSEGSKRGVVIEGVLCG